MSLSKFLTTPFYSLHLSQKGKLIPFYNTLLPLSYPSQSISQSVLHTRQKASLFDVSHMLQLKVSKDIIRKASVAKITDIGGCGLSVFVNSNGGIVDDFVFSVEDSDELFVVANAGCKDKDLKYLNETKNSLGNGVVENISEKYGLLALQGPKSASILQAATNLTEQDLQSFKFMTHRKIKFNNNVVCQVSRSGYTGEDGFEIQIPIKDCISTAELLFSSANGDLEWAGLGSRDVLRLEGGMCLYGHDLSENVSPVEASLNWVIDRSRSDYVGYDVIKKHLEEGVKRKRVGFIMDDNVIAREGYLIYNESGDDEVGVVTSGCPSPCLMKSIGMGYVDLKLSKIGSKVMVGIRGKKYSATISKMPFVKTNYFK